MKGVRANVEVELDERICERKDKLKYVKGKLRLMAFDESVCISTILFSPAHQISSDQEKLHMDTSTAVSGVLFPFYPTFHQVIRAIFLSSFVLLPIATGGKRGHSTCCGIIAW